MMTVPALRGLLCLVGLLNSAAMADLKLYELTNEILVLTAPSTGMDYLQMKVDTPSFLEPVGFDTGFLSQYPSDPSWSQLTNDGSIITAEGDFTTLLHLAIYFEDASASVLHLQFYHGDERIDNYDILKPADLTWSNLQGGYISIAPGTWDTERLSATCVPVPGALSLGLIGLAVVRLRSRC